MTLQAKASLRQRRRYLKREFHGHPDWKKWNDPVYQRRRKQQYDLQLFASLDRPGVTPVGVPNRHIAKFGWAFLTRFPKQEIPFENGHFKIERGPGRFESPVSVDLCQNNLLLGEARLSFGPGRQIRVEALQGVIGERKGLRAFSTIIRMPWPNYLMKKIIAHARRTGYKTIAFRDPTRLPNFNAPVVDAIMEKKGLSEIEAEKFAQQKMVEFYQKIREGTKPWEREGDYWVKKLR